MTKRIVLALAISIISGAAFAQPAQNQDRTGKRYEQMSPQDARAQAEAVRRDPVADADKRLNEWKQGRVNCLVQAGLKRPTSGYGVDGDDFIITENNRINIADWVWRRNGVNAQAAYACTPEGQRAAGIR